MAAHYALARWEALMRYRDDGHLEIDNNAAERSVRAVALGRKNYLLAGSDRGGESAAANLQPDWNGKAERDRSRKLFT
jgi:transposase